MRRFSSLALLLAVAACASTPLLAAAAPPTTSTTDSAEVRMAEVTAPPASDSASAPAPSALPAPVFADTVQLKLNFWAQCMAARFDAPVRLIGSSLVSPTPRDVDIRIVIDDRQFTGRYHVEPTIWASEHRGQAWVDDMAKMNRTLAGTHRLNADVQVWPASHWIEYEDGHPFKARILAAPSPRWHHPTEDALRAWHDASGARTLEELGVRPST